MVNRFAVRIWIITNIILVAGILYFQRESSNSHVSRYFNLDWRFSIIILVIINMLLFFMRRLIIDNCPRCGSYDASAYETGKGSKVRCYACNYDGLFNPSYSPKFSKKVSEMTDSEIEREAKEFTEGENDKFRGGGSMTAKQTVGYAARWAAVTGTPYHRKTMFSFNPLEDYKYDRFRNNNTKLLLWITILLGISNVLLIPLAFMENAYFFVIGMGLIIGEIVFYYYMKSMD